MHSITRSALPLTLVVLGLLGLLGLLVGACAPAAEAPPEEATAAPPTAFQPANTLPEAAAFAEPIEAAHGAERWYSRDAFGAAIELVAGGQEVFTGTLWTTPEVGRTRLELADGTVAVFDGERAWVAPESSTLENARFHLLTWPYFLALPMKLRDAGSRLEPAGQAELGGRTYDTARLTFDAGVGDAPDDWYVLYRDPDTDRLAAAQFIVTYGRHKAAAEKEREVILYDGWRELDGVAIPTEWRIHLYGDEGIGDLLGEVKLDEPRFVVPPADAFAAPAGAREAPLPGAGAGLPEAEESAAGDAEGH